jgi:hypothetical protein
MPNKSTQKCLIVLKWFEKSCLFSMSQAPIEGTEERKTRVRFPADSEMIGNVIILILILHVGHKD